MNRLHQPFDGCISLLDEAGIEADLGSIGVAAVVLAIVEGAVCVAVGPPVLVIALVGHDEEQFGHFAGGQIGEVPNLLFIVPNQCDDQHGRSNGDAYCAFDYGQNNSGYTYGTQVGLNPGLIQQGDTTIERLVQAIDVSPAWHRGPSAIVIVWDENDYSGSTTLLTGLFPSQNQNRVVLTVDTNYENHHGVQSSTYYTSFSLLKSMEAGFHLPCLNHACDAGVQVMSDLFGRWHGDTDSDRF